jgi:hypothetical protein
MKSRGTSADAKQRHLAILIMIELGYTHKEIQQQLNLASHASVLYHYRNKCNCIIWDFERRRVKEVTRC